MTIIQSKLLRSMGGVCQLYDSLEGVKVLVEDGVCLTAREVEDYPAARVHAANGRPRFVAK